MSSDHCFKKELTKVMVTRICKSMTNNMTFITSFMARTPDPRVLRPALYKPTVAHFILGSEKD